MLDSKRTPLGTSGSLFFVAALSLVSTLDRPVLSAAFVVPSSCPLFQTPSSLQQSSVGDLFSGLTGSAPDKLEPPVGLLSGTSIDPSLPNVDLSCVYKASVDGWSAVNFHSCVDGRGSGFVIVLNQSGKRFGGFNPLGWMSTDDYGSSNAAWLWCMSKGDSKPVRVPILRGGNTAIFDYATGGPCFGAADLVIGPPRAAVMGGFAGPDMEDTSVNAGNLRECTSSVGGAYDVPPRGWPSGSSKAVEVEVYCNANVDPRSSSSSGGGGFDWWPF